MRATSTADTATVDILASGFFVLFIIGILLSVRVGPPEDPSRRWNVVIRVTWSGSNGPASSTGYSHSESLTVEGLDVFDLEREDGAPLGRGTFTPGERAASARAPRGVIVEQVTMRGGAAEGPSRSSRSTLLSLPYGKDRSHRISYHLSVPPSLLAGSPTELEVVALSPRHRLVHTERVPDLLQAQSHGGQREIAILFRLSDASNELNWCIVTPTSQGNHP